jgi:hypothetical protein
MSDVLPEDERRSVDVERRDTEQLERVDVSFLPLFDLKVIHSAMHRELI